MAVPYVDVCAVVKVCSLLLLFWMFNFIMSLESLWGALCNVIIDCVRLPWFVMLMSFHIIFYMFMKFFCHFDAPSFDTSFLGYFSAILGVTLTCLLVLMMMRYICFTHIL